MKQSRRISIPLIALGLVACTGVAEQNNRGNDLIHSRAYDSAVEAFTSAQVDDPNNPIPYLNSARAYFEQGDMEHVVAVIDQAILRGDEQLKAEAYFNLGNYYFQSQQLDDAINAYRESLLINPDDNNARQNLELALRYLASPTPFDDEMKTNPEESQVDPTAQPTNQPQDFQEPSPTPTPPKVTNDDDTPVEGVAGTNFGLDGGTPSPLPDSTLSANEAKELLDPLKQDEAVFDVFSDEVATPTDSEEYKDW